MIEKFACWPKGFQGLILWLLGAMTSLAFAPTFWVPLAVIGFSALLILSSRDDISMSRFWMGWFFGFGHFTVGLYWTSYAMLVDAARFWWIIPFSLFGLPSLLAFLSATALWVYNKLNTQHLSRWVCFCVAWVLSEYIRGMILTGFPWNLAAYMWAFHPVMIQGASVLGSYGLSLITLLTITSPGLFSMAPRSMALRGLAVALVLLGAQAGFGLYRLHQAPMGDANNTPFYVRIVQANIPQSLKWDRRYSLQHLQTFMTLSGQPSAKPLDAVIWPESATPFFLEQEPVLRDKIRLIIPHGGYLMVGGLRLGYINHTQRHWNSLLVINDRGSVVATYDKAHLVPFGEYVPFRETLSLIIPPSWLQKVTPGSDDFDAGFGPKTIAQTSLPPFSPLICYEAIFPGEVADAVAYPAWLLNVSNDGWFGLSSGPPQHLVSATFRAVEEGIPMMRAANTGISAVIDSYGRIVTSIPLQETGIVDAYLPRPATDEPFFRHYGNRIFWVMVVLLSLMIRLPRKRLSTKGSDHAT